MSVVLLASSCLNAATVSSDPDFFLRTWDAEDGLPSETVNAVAQSPDGFLWVATGGGLARFDGVEFKRFTLENPAGPKDNNLTRLLAARDGTVWVASESGEVARFQAKRLVRLELSPALHGARITALAEDGEGGLWIATADNGVARWRAGQLELFDKSAGLPPESVLALARNRAGEVWLGAGGRFLLFNNGQWQAPRNATIPRSRIETLSPSADGGLWAGVSIPHPFFAGAQLAKLKDGGWPQEPGPYPWLQDSARSRIHALLEDSEQTIWVGTEGSGVYYRATGQAWRRLQPEGLLSRLIITSIFEDRHHTIWIGAEHGGLTQVRRKLVTTLELPQPGGDRLITTATAGKDGSVWIGTGSAGVFRYRDGVFSHFDIGLQRGALYVNALLEDRQTNLWAGTWDGLLKLKDGRFEPVAGPPELQKIVMALLEDRAGNLWIGGSGGLARKHGDTTRVYGKAEGLGGSDIRSLAEDPSGAIWVAVRNDGLYRLANDRFESFTNWPASARLCIRALHCDREGALWIGTFGEGLYRWQAGRFAGWTTRDGLPDNTLKAVVEDRGGTLWLSSDNGLFGIGKQKLNEFHPSSSPLPCLHLTLADGLVTRVGSGGGHPVVAETADGRLWFPMGKALAVFDPVTLPPTRPPGFVLVEEVRVDGAAREFEADAAMKMPSSARRIEFRYTAPQFVRAEEARFRHRLEGMDTDWVDAGTRRSASYSQLPPGHYTFRVMVGNDEGGWREAAQLVTIEVVPRYWQTRWFKALCLLLLAGAAAATVGTIERARARRRIAQFETEKAVEQERRRIARDLHDDIGASVSQLTLLGELAGRQSSSPAVTRQHLANIVQKSRDLARAVHEIIWAVNPRNDSLLNLVGYLQQYSSEFFDGSAVRCRMDAPLGLPAVPLAVQVRHNLFLAAKEALHNALKHSGAGEVWLRVRCDNSSIEICVEDNGHGFVPGSRQGAGNGLANMRARLQAIGGSCDIQSAPGAGCNVRFALALAAGSAKGASGNSTG